MATKTEVELPTTLTALTDDPKFDLLIFIGRMQPFHNEHKRIIDRALGLSRKALVLVGSAGSPRTPRNPWTYIERQAMIEFCYHAEGAEKVPLIEPLYDKTYNDEAWIKQVQDYAAKHTRGIKKPHIGLIGCSKDHTSWYLKMFPQWESVNVELINLIHATGIREPYLEGRIEQHEISDNVVPRVLANWLFSEFRHNEGFQGVQDWHLFAKIYKKQWERREIKEKDGSITVLNPYPVQFQTADNVVTQSGHILLIKRIAQPGQGLWALPGGFVNPNETVLEAALRELEEETKLQVSKRVLRGSIVGEFRADDPHRSTIGRIVTTAFHFKLEDMTELPEVRGADDAEKARWTPISALKEEMLYDDHYHIINKMLGL